MPAKLIFERIITAQSNPQVKFHDLFFVIIILKEIPSSDSVCSESSSETLLIIGLPENQSRRQ